MCKSSDLSPQVTVWSLSSWPPTYMAWNPAQETNDSFPPAWPFPTMRHGAWNGHYQYHSVYQKWEWIILLSFTFSFWSLPTFTMQPGLHKLLPTSVQRPRQYAPHPEMSFQGQTSLGWAHWNHHLGWRTVSLTLSFPGNVTLKWFHFNTHFQKAHKNNPNSENFTLWVEADEMLN